MQNNTKNATIKISIEVIYYNIGVPYFGIKRRALTSWYIWTQNLSSAVSEVAKTRLLGLHSTNVVFKFGSSAKTKDYRENHHELPTDDIYTRHNAEYIQTFLHYKLYHQTQITLDS